LPFKSFDFKLNWAMNGYSWSFPHSWINTGFVTRVTRRMSLVQQELFTLSEHMSSPSILSRVRFGRSLVFCVVFCRSLFVLFCLAILLANSVYGLWLPIWYLQTLNCNYIQFFWWTNRKNDSIPFSIWIPMTAWCQMEVNNNVSTWSKICIDNMIVFWPVKITSLSKLILL